MAGKPGRCGRRKKTLPGKLLHGTFRADRDGSKAEAVAEQKEAIAAGPLDPPVGLSPAEREAWQRVAPTIAKLGVIRNERDRDAFTRYIQALVEWQEAVDAVRAEWKAAKERAGALRWKLEEQGPENTWSAEDVAALDLIERQVMYKGILVPKNGNLVRNPGSLAIAQADKRCRDFLIEYGLTPVSSARLAVSRGMDAPSRGAAGEFLNDDPKTQQG